MKDDTANYADEVAGPRLIAVQKKESIIAKSFDKLKETSTVWIFTTLPQLEVDYGHITYMEALFDVSYICIKLMS